MIGVPVQAAAPVFVVLAKYRLLETLIGEGPASNGGAHSNMLKKYVRKIFPIVPSSEHPRHSLVAVTRTLTLSNKTRIRYEAAVFFRAASIKIPCWRHHASLNAVCLIYNICCLILWRTGKKRSSSSPHLHKCVVCQVAETTVCI